MNKIYLIFTQMIIFVEGIIIGPTPIFKTVGFKTIKIPPLSSTKDTILEIEAVVSSKDPIDYTLTVQYSPQNIDSYYFLNNATGIGTDFKVNIVFNKHRYTPGETTFRFLLNSTTFDKTIELVLEAYGGVRKNISLSSNDINAYESNKNYVWYSLLRIENGTYSEKINFINFTKEQEQSYYNQLDISKFYFEYTCVPSPTLVVEEGYMLLQNYNDWFKNIGTPFGQFRKLDIVINQVGKVCHFELANTLYIDPKTNTLYSDYQDNRFPTKKLYLPKNGYSGLDELILNFNLKGVGHNEATISQTFLFSCARNYFGDCHNSEYCISANESESNYQYGEVEEH